MKTLSDESMLLLKTYCTLKGIKGEIDEHGNVLEITKKKGADSTRTILGINVRTVGPEIEEKSIKTNLQELMGQCMGIEYNPNDIVRELIRIGMLNGQR